MNAPDAKLLNNLLAIQGEPRGNTLAECCPQFAELIRRCIEESERGEEDKAERTWAEAAALAKAFSAGSDFFRADVKRVLINRAEEGVIGEFTLRRMLSELGLTYV